MCTVTFVKRNGKTILTSNRDEAWQRQATPPLIENRKGKTLLFPKDPLAGGTWFVMDDSGNVVVLLNGAAEKHRHRPPYRRSRGLTLLDLMEADDFVYEWNAIDLHDIEPFTLVAFIENGLFRMRWDGTEKERIELDTNHDHIFSSTTLYPAEVRAEREVWFRDFLHDHPSPSETELLGFHRNTHLEDRENGLVMQRGDILKTISITQAVVADGKMRLVHDDLISGERYTEQLPVS